MYGNGLKSPKASFVILDQSGYILQIEQENLFNSLVNKWLESIEHSKHNC